MSVSALFAVFRLLACRTAAMCAGDILLLLGFGFHLAIVFRLITPTSEADTVFEDILKIVHSCLVYGLQLTVYGLQLTVYGLQLITLPANISSVNCKPSTVNNLMME